jgi:hypothetical protein
MIRRNENGTFSQGTNCGKQFKKGNRPWNKGLKEIHMHPDTEFKNDQYVGESHPSWKGGVQTMKADGVYLWAGKNNRVRRSRKVYKDTYGEIPRGYVIYHIDGDNFNDSPSNLEAICRSELLRRNASKNRKR